MNRFKELMKAVSGVPEVIVRLGAGTSSEFESYKVNSSRQVIYVEPDPHLAEVADESFNNITHVRVIPCAIAVKNGLQTLYITNNKRFSSLLLPKVLLDFYPNIKVEDQVQVEAITLSELCQDEEIGIDTDNLLIAELQGMEKEVFPAAEIVTLQKFKWIILRSSEENLYEHSSVPIPKDLADVMQEAGFVVLVFKEDAPPFVNILCIRNDAVIENTKLQSEKNDLKETAGILEHKLSIQLTKLNDLQTSQAVSVSELDKAQTLTKSLTDELSEAQNLSKSLTDELSEAQNLITSLTDKRTEAQNLSTSLTDELSEAQNLITSLNNDKENQQQEHIYLVDAMKEKSKEISDLQQTLRINSKLILKSDADLRDLQLQYSAALQRQDQQHNLLTELTEKLRQASVYYQKLNLQKLVFDDEVLEQEGSDDKEPAGNDNREN